MAPHPPTAERPAQEPTWYVARTNPRCEERALAGLIAAGFAAHLPRGSKQVRRRFTKSRRLVSFPLLTGYVFVGLSSSTPHFYELRRVDGVCAILGAGGRPVAIPASTIEDFQRLEAGGVFSEGARPKVFDKGERIIVRTGPLAGTVVHFEDRSGTKAARVISRLFGQQRLMTIALDDLEKLGASNG